MSEGFLGDSAEGALPALALGWVVALLFLWLWWSRTRFARLLKDIPSTPIRGVFVGLVETSGKVEHDDPMIATLSGLPCVHYVWSVAEHWRRTQTYKDSKGRTQTRVVHGSDVVASGGESSDLRLRDATGAIIVRSLGASWTPVSTFARSATRGDALYHTQAPDRVVAGSTGRRTFSESAVPVGYTAWVIGNARVRFDGLALEIGSGADEGIFMISLAGERSHAITARVLAWLGLVLGTACAGGAGMALASAVRLPIDGVDERTGGIVLASANLALWLLVVAGMWAFIVRNGAVRVRTRWERAASLVDVELKRRADLIPNLVAVTRGGAAHEAAVQRAMAELRAGAATPGVFGILVERYPTLRADAAFLALQRELTETESRIAQSRTFEIQSRERLLERLGTFPEGLIARVMGVSRPPPSLASPAPPPSSPGNPPPG
jgi:hypothetical protein